MSDGMCNSASNNIHFDFPPIMSDGRNYATWQPGSKISDDIREKAGIKSNWQYRKYMQDNADSIIKHNQLDSCDQCSSCPASYGTQNETQNRSPFLYKSCIEQTQPYGYERSDLKSIYLSTYQLQCRMFTPVMTQEQLINAGFQNHN
jgi:hypothetical protein